MVRAAGSAPVISSQVSCFSFWVARCGKRRCRRSRRNDLNCIQKSDQDHRLSCISRERRCIPTRMRRRRLKAHLSKKNTASRSSMGTIILEARMTSGDVLLREGIMCLFVPGPWGERMVGNLLGKCENHQLASQKKGVTMIVATCAKAETNHW